MEFPTKDWVLVAQVVSSGATIPVAVKVDAPTPAAAIEKFVARYPRPVEFIDEVRSVCVYKTEAEVNRGLGYSARWLKKNWFKKTPDSQGRTRTKVIDEICGGYICRPKKAKED